ncbi:S8 family serine peptidase [Paracidovorax avenae]|uniref:S8 family serine peptidase n=1 Tax=Paracidovorax avenae TaxID=80867 RepID=UPI001864078F|nr:S8 family serine peptidase [Paracidovorax avenae]
MAKLNPGVNLAAVDSARRLRFFPCPYWYFGSAGVPPTTNIRAGESLAVVAETLMVTSGGKTLSSVRALNPGLFDVQGIATRDGSIKLPYIAKRVHIPVTSSETAAWTAASVVNALPLETKKVINAKGTEFSPNEYQLVATNAVELEEAARECHLPDATAAWPVDIAAVNQAVEAVRAGLPVPPPPGLILIADTGADVGDPQLRGAFWVNAYVANGYPSPTNYRNDLHGASMVIRSGDADALMPPAPGYAYATHGADIARIIVEPGAREAALSARTQIAIAKLNDSATPFRIGVESVPTALNYARLIAADVVNLSVVIGEPTENLRAALAAANFVVVAAAGNQSDWVDTLRIYPPGLTQGREKLIVVGAHDWEGKRSYFSNIGQYVDILAPGCAIRIIDASGQSRVISGTSFAVPFVSHTISLLRAVGVPPHPVALKLRVLATGRFDARLEGVTRYGVRLDMERAIHVKEDSLVIIEATHSGTAVERIVYGTIEPSEYWTCEISGAGKVFRPKDVYKVVMRDDDGKRKPRIWTLGPDGGSLMFTDCSAGFEQVSLRFKAKGDVAAKAYPWSSIRDVVPRLRF